MAGLFLLGAANSRRARKYWSYYLGTSGILVILVMFLIKILLGIEPFERYDYQLNFLLRGPAHFDFVISSSGLMLNTLIGVTLWFIQGFLTDYSMYFRMTIGLIVLLNCLVSLVYNQKITSNIKITFLTKLRIKQE